VIDGGVQRERRDEPSRQSTAGMARDAPGQGRGVDARGGDRQVDEKVAGWRGADERPRIQPRRRDRGGEPGPAPARSISPAMATVAPATTPCSWPRIGAPALA